MTVVEYADIVQAYELNGVERDAVARLIFDSGMFYIREFNEALAKKAINPFQTAPTCFGLDMYIDLYGRLNANIDLPQFSRDASDLIDYLYDLGDTLVARVQSGQPIRVFSNEKDCIASVGR